MSGVLARMQSDQLTRDHMIDQVEALDAALATLAHPDGSEAAGYWLRQVPAEEHSGLMRAIKAGLAKGVSPDRLDAVAASVFAGLQDWRKSPTQTARESRLSELLAEVLGDLEDSLPDIDPSNYLDT